MGEVFLESVAGTANKELLVIDDTRTGKTRWFHNHRVSILIMEVVLYHDQNVSVFITAAY